MDDTILNFNYPTDTPKIIKVIAPALGQPRNALAERYTENTHFRQTCGMDHARYVAMYRYLPLRTGV